MSFIVFITSTIIAGLVLDNPWAGLIIGAICLVLFFQHKRIQDLETRQYSKTPELSPNKICSEEPCPKPTKTEAKQPYEDTHVATPPVKPPPPSPEPIREAPRHARSSSKPGMTLHQFLESIFGATITNFILNGNTIARIGAVILILGVAFSLKFVADQGLFPIELRLIFFAVLSIACLYLGWSLRKSRSQFALILQGTGAGVFYITTFIAFKIYHLIPGPLALTLFILITALSAALAVLQNTQTLAALAMIAGFLAPILSSEGGGSHIALFSYIAVLNLGIFVICWYRAWRFLNVAAYLFTFFIAASWGYNYYQDKFYVSCQIFLIFFAAFYSLLNILYSIRQMEKSLNRVDSMITFGTPVMYSILQWNLVENLEYGVAFSAAAFGCFHLILSRALFITYKQQLRALIESYIIVGLILVSLAVPFAFSTWVSSAIWALEAAALIWNGIRQRSFATRLLGFCLLPLASILFLCDIHQTSHDLAFANPFFTSILLLTFAHLVSGALLIRSDSGVVGGKEKWLGHVFLVLSALWWGGGIWDEVGRHHSRWFTWFFEHKLENIGLDRESFAVSIFSLFTTFSVIAFWGIFKKWRLPGRVLIWRVLIPAHFFLLLGFLLGCMLVVLKILDSTQYTSYIHHFLSFPGIFTWPLFFAAHYFILNKEDGEHDTSPYPWQHLFSFWLLTGIVTWESLWFISAFISNSAGWLLGILIGVPSLLAILFCRISKRTLFWPINKNIFLYSNGLWLPIWWSLIIGFISSLASSAFAFPLPYIPLLNPFDLAELVAAIGVFFCIKQIGSLNFQLGDRWKLPRVIIGPWLFFLATASLLRTIHYWTGVPWDIDDLFDSEVVQASLSIFWCVLALILMVISHLKGYRTIWKSGALLVGIVVLKLLTIDLANHGTLARIVAFLGVGLLMLLIGYFAPIPPEQKENR